MTFIYCSLTLALLVPNILFNRLVLNACNSAFSQNKTNFTTVKNSWISVVFVHTHTHTYIYMCVCVYVCVCVCVCVS